MEENNSTKRQFRGWFIPADIVYLFQDGKLNATEMVLLATIDSLVSKGKGCWAGNEALGKMTRMSTSSVAHAIVKLVKMELVIRTGFNGRIRTLETAWSRQHCQKRQGSIAKNGKAVLPKTASPNILDKSISQTTVSKETVANRSVRHQRPDQFSSNFDRKAAGHLRELLVQHDSDLVASSNGRRTVKIETFAKSITKLRTERSVPRDQIKGMIQWLKANYADEWTPKIRKAGDLCTNWEKYRDAKRRWHSARGESDSTVKPPLRPMKGDIYLNVLRKEVYAVLDEEGVDSNGTVFQYQVDKALERLGHPAGAFTAKEFFALITGEYKYEN